MANVRLVKRKTMNKKKVVSLKNKTLYALVRKVGEKVFCMTELKENANHAVNSYLAHSGGEKDMKNMMVVEIKMIGKPIVKTTRNITIKK